MWCLYTPLSPPSAPLQRRIQGPPAKSKFLAVSSQGRNKSADAEGKLEKAVEARELSVEAAKNRLMQLKKQL